jgi:thioredoxin-dependent peroxiredoxin
VWGVSRLQATLPQLSQTLKLQSYLKEESKMALSIGSEAIDFRLSDENGNIRSLSEFRGKPVVLYFYPKDDTPGCTKEACAFRDDYSAYDSVNVIILGVSPDSPKSHLKFKEKYDLPFPLLADEDHRVCEQYQAWGPKKFRGREYEGVLRTTYLIGADGKIVKVYENVKPAEHSAEILADLKALT